MHAENDILNRILLIRGKKVMIDRDLAELYGVTTKRLNEQVKRNASRFPEDFMFQLTESEKKEVVAICDHLKILVFSPNLPFAFTEHGAVMLASVLNSERAIQANIQIVRVFTTMREMVISNKDILLKIEKIEHQIGKHDKELMVVFETLRKMIEKPPAKRNRIGFLRNDEI
jgi:hypothetical protein